MSKIRSHEKHVMQDLRVCRCHDSLEAILHIGPGGEDMASRITVSRQPPGCFLRYEGE